jgi:LacI family transcriptional regulator
MDLSLTYSEDFKSGYTRALREHGLDVVAELVVAGDLTQASGYDQMKRLLAKRTAFDGVYVVNDMMTLGAFEAARQEGFCIPKDFLLFAGSLNGITYVKPRVTGFLQDFDKLGKTACSMLISMLEKKYIQEKRVILKGSFQLGETTYTDASFML